MINCSFCGKTPREGVVIYNSQIADAHICDECLVLCGEVITNPTKEDVIEACLKDAAKCSFCGKNSQDVKPLIQGPAGLVHICAICVRSGAEAMLKYLEQTGDNPKEVKDASA